MTVEEDRGYRCTVCGREGTLLEFAFIPYPVEGEPDPPDARGPDFRCPLCGGGIEERPAA